MEFFNEVKNRYFHIALKVINESENGLNRKDIIKIVDKEEFQEKIIGKDFKTFEGLLLNEYDENKNFNFLREENGLYYPSISKVPIRTTNIEKIWLKNLLNEDNLKLFVNESTIVKLRESLKDVVGPSITESIEITNKSILPEVPFKEQYEANFRILLNAIIAGKTIGYCNTDRLGNKYCSELLPLIEVGASCFNDLVTYYLHRLKFGLF